MNVKSVSLCLCYALFVSGTYGEFPTYKHPDSNHDCYLCPPGFRINGVLQSAKKCDIRSDGMPSFPDCVKCPDGYYLNRWSIEHNCIEQSYCDKDGEFILHHGSTSEPTICGCKKRWYRDGERCIKEEACPPPKPLPRVAQTKPRTTRQIMKTKSVLSSLAIPVSSTTTTTKILTSTKNLSLNNIQTVNCNCNTITLIAVFVAIIVSVILICGTISFRGCCKKKFAERLSEHIPHSSEKSNTDKKDSRKSLQYISPNKTQDPDLTGESQYVDMKSTDILLTREPPLLVDIRSTSSRDEHLYCNDEDPMLQEVFKVLSKYLYGKDVDRFLRNVLYLSGQEVDRIPNGSIDEKIRRACDHWKQKNPTAGCNVIIQRLKREGLTETARRCEQAAGFTELNML